MSQTIILTTSALQAVVAGGDSANPIVSIDFTQLVVTIRDGGEFVPQSAIVTVPLGIAISTAKVHAETV